MTGSSTARRASLVVAFVLAVTGLAAASAGAAPGADGWSPTVESFVTDLATDQRLAEQPAVAWHSGPGTAAQTIVVDPNRTYQTMTGFGASMTDSSAYVLSKLPTRTRNQIMTELFSPTKGIGLSMLRQPMGASDFAVDKAYSYDDRLKFRNPPFFLDPVKAGWRVLRVNEQVPAR